MALTPDQQRRMRVRRMNLLMAYASFASSKAVAWTPAELFAQGEQGVWYDPSDMTTLFQDAAGTTPVTAVEQPVGLMLDKSRGLVLGSELVTNGDFSNGLTGWTNNSNGTGTAAVSGGVLTLTRTDASNRGRVDQGVTTVAGRTYKVTGDISNLTIQAAATNGGAGFASSSTGVLFFTATGTTTFIAILGISGTTGTADNISVRELPGNHASQSTAASRPVLSARVNLLTRTEQFDDAVWLKGRSSATNTTATTDPLGGTTADKLTEDTQTGAHYVGNLGSSINFAATNYVWSCYIKAAERGFAVLGTGSLGGETGLPAAGIAINLSTGVVTATNGTFSASSVTDAGNGWWRASITVLGTAATGRLWVAAAQNGTSADIVATGYTGDGTSGIYIWGADLRPANAGANLPAYQRVGAATAGTSTTAGNADYDTNGFPMYLRFDGTDDSMATGTINPGSVDKAQVFAGVRKLSDAAQGVVAEWSATIASNNGTFLLAAPDGATATFGFDSKGTTQVDAVASSQTAPLTAVLSGLADISGDIATIRVNGAQADQDTGDQGTGNYLSYPLYIGSRAGTSLRFNGQLYSLIARFSATNLPDATIAQTETWVNGKTGAY